MTSVGRTTLSIGAVVLQSVIVSLCNAQPYPAKAISIIHTSAASSSSDVAMRIITAQITKNTGQQFVVEGRQGGGGTVAALAVKSSTSDGYTVLYTTSGSMAQNQFVQKDFAFDPEKDFVPITPVVTNAVFFLIPSTHSAKTLAEVLALGRSKPGGLNFVSIGTLSDLISGTIRLATGTPITNVYYKSNSLATGDLLSGRLDFVVTSLLGVKPLIDAGKLRALAVGWHERVKAFPNVPTFAEQGIDMPSFNWLGLFAPTGTPEVAVRFLHREFTKALNAPNVKQSLEDYGSFATTSESPEAFGRWLGEYRSTMSKLIKTMGMQPK